MFRPAAAVPLLRGWFGCGDTVVWRGQDVARAESRNFACNTPVQLAVPHFCRSSLRTGRSSRSSIRMEEDTETESLLIFPHLFWSGL